MPAVSEPVPLIVTPAAEAEDIRRPEPPTVSTFAPSAKIAAVVAGATLSVLTDSETVSVTPVEVST